jgi:hypothetical protein
MLWNWLGKPGDVFNTYRSYPGADTKRTLDLAGNVGLLLLKREVLKKIIT